MTTLLRPTRPGSDIANAWPSRTGNRLRYRDGRITDLQGNPIVETPAPAPHRRTQPAPQQRGDTPIHAHPRRSKSEGYQPIPGTRAGRIVEALQHARARGIVNAHLTGADALDLLAITPSGFAEAIRAPITHGHLVRVEAHGRVAVALPGTWNEDQLPARPLNAGDITARKVRQAA